VGGGSGGDASSRRGRTTVDDSHQAEGAKDCMHQAEGAKDCMLNGAQAKHAQPLRVVPVPVLPVEASTSEQCMLPSRYGRAAWQASGCRGEAEAVGGRSAGYECDWREGVDARGGQP